MLQVNSLTKTFRLARKKRAREQSLDPRQKGRWFHAIDSIDLGVSRGQVLGLLGPNGAGKTTLLRILSTSLIRKLIGFVSGNTGLYGRLTAREMLRYYGKLHGMAAAALDGRIGSLAQKLDMGWFLDQRNETLSSGMRQKVSIARALIHDPEILVFHAPHGRGGSVVRQRGYYPRG